MKLQLWVDLFNPKFQILISMHTSLAQADTLLAGGGGT
jgi:hypothetical protein